MVERKNGDGGNRTHETSPPKDYWLYRAYGRAGDLLYIGITGAGMRRFRGHQRNESRWSAEVARLDIEHYGSAEAVRAAEARAVRAEQPRDNIQLVDSAKPRYDEPRPSRNWDGPVWGTLDPDVRMAVEKRLYELGIPLPDPDAPLPDLSEASA